MVIMKTEAIKNTATSIPILADSDGPVEGKRKLLYFKRNPICGRRWD
jgi:hypothetical protein